MFLSLAEECWLVLGTAWRTGNFLVFISSNLHASSPVICNQRRRVRIFLLEVRFSASICGIFAFASLNVSFYSIQFIWLFAVCQFHTTKARSSHSLWNLHAVSFGLNSICRGSAANFNFSARLWLFALNDNWVLLVLCLFHFFFVCRTDFMYTHFFFIPIIWLVIARPKEIYHS